MPQPEILRRCPVCGAASRPGALFCPQCGSSAKRPGSDVTETAPTEALPEPPLDPRMRTRKLEAAELEVQPEAAKLRKGPTVVLADATYDPSRRFVLVAAILFLL